ncbi:MAG: hypothetical protein CMG74_01785 [Candidatus Marinimicrobia bacterium]|nr:hypothetical protein [Candidatus Neomarinimicrobiota bacterium]
MSNSKFRWGIIGTGGIAKTFANDLCFTKNHRVTAVGSRSSNSALEFSSKYPGCKSYGSYSELVSDPDLDGVYIATPHSLHKEHTIMALQAGKPVLCEKPFSINEREARLMISVSQEKNLTLMEAMWTRFLPHIAKVREILNSGTLGTIFTLQADFGQKLTSNKNPRLWEPKLGGGALLDMGIYPVSFAHMVLGKPSSITAQSTFTDKGVDAQTSAVFAYENGAQSIISASSHNQTACTAHISGSNGFLEIDSLFFCPTAMRIELYDGSKIEYPNTYKGHGLREQAIEFARCVQSREIESSLLPHQESIAVMKSMDQIREQIGLRYPNE